ncbi:MAG: monovalent cation/H(+) antiporter subunit G [Candidatus Cloacimonetes bacterium]|nr:monovalent cation/H(+) antiporter subunit G [Candidatus Cloacimonadota bacterium]
MVIAYFFIVIGLIIMFFGILGMIILPNFLLRIHSSTKCGVTGAINILIGFMFYSLELDFLLRMGLIMIFLFFTAPIIAHSLAVFHLQGRNIDQEDQE